MAAHVLKLTSSLFSNFSRSHAFNSVVLRGLADQVKLVLYNPFQNAKEKNKNAYLEMIKLFEHKEPKRRGHVEFIYSALRNMEEFGVHKDLEVYKKLIDVLPKGRFVATNLIQSEFMHYPKQQQCAIDLLEQMEDNGVMPDYEMEETLLNVFGKRGYPLRKFWRMMYWMPKFKNLSPWRLPQELPDDAMELAKLAIQRITSVDNDMKLSVFETSDIAASLDKTWIVSAQSPIQMKLLVDEYEYHQKNPKQKCDPLVVRGAFIVRLKDQIVSYFTLTSTYRKRDIPEVDVDDVSKINVPSYLGSTKLPVLPPSVHEQDDGNILAVCATGTSSRDSLLSWVRLLEIHGNPMITNIPVIFTLTAPPSELMVPGKVFIKQKQKLK